MSEKIRVPAFGDGGGEGDVIELMVKIGDRIEADQSILTLESDKATMDIPAPKSGVIKSMKVKLGDRLKEGDELFELEVEGESAVAPTPTGAPAVGPADYRSEGSSSVDTPEQRSHTQTMSDVTMDQIDQKLSGIEERMDKRIDRMEAAEEQRALSWRREQEAYRKEQEARDRLYAERSEATSRRLEDRDKIIDSKLDAVNASIISAGVKIGGLESQLSTTLKAVKDSNRSTAHFIIGTVIASVLAMLAINATIIYGAKSFFDAGKESAALQSSIEDLKKSISPPKLEPAPAPAPAPAAAPATAK